MGMFLGGSQNFKFFFLDFFLGGGEGMPDIPIL